MKKLISIILCGLMLACLVAFTACGGGEETPCTTHADTDKDGLCDVCQEEMPPCVHVDLNKDLICDTCRERLEEEKISVTITIKGQDDVGVSDATITLTDKDDNKTVLTTNDRGTATKDLVAGSYSVSIENLPQYWYSDSNYTTITVSKANATFNFVAIDNSPNGTDEKPFPVEDAETGEPASVAFPANVTYTFVTKSVVKRYLVINNENVKVTYKGAEYTAENGVVRVLIDATTSNDITYIKITNTSDEENTVSLTFEAMPGTVENPIDITYGYIHKATIVKGEQVYYKATATQTGYIAVHCGTEFNNVSISNLTTYNVSEATRGGEATYVYARTGDEISVCVELMSEAEDNTPIEVGIMVQEQLGTDFNMITLYESETFTIKAGETIYFATGTPVSLQIATQGSFLLNGTDATTLEGVDNFYVTNQGEDDADITFVIEFLTNE